MSEWRPVATAQLADGLEADLWVPGRGRITGAVWFSGQWRQWIDWRSDDDLEDNPLWVDGFGYTEPVHDVTHWQPLPEPPVQS